jgi:hypothetical protein
VLGVLRGYALIQEFAERKHLEVAEETRAHREIEIPEKTDTIVRSQMEAT